MSSSTDSPPVNADPPASESASTDAPSDAATAPSAASPDTSWTDEQARACLLETRAAIDVIFEMLALNHSEGDEDLYRETLFALKQRHQQAIENVRTGPPDASDDASEPAGDRHPGPQEPPVDVPHLEAVDAAE